MVNRFPGNVYSVNYIFLRGAEADIFLFRFQLAGRRSGIREHKRSEKGVIFLRFDRLVIARLSVFPPSTGRNLRLFQPRRGRQYLWKVLFILFYIIFRMLARCYD